MSDDYPPVPIEQRSRAEKNKLYHLVKAAFWNEFNATVAPYPADDTFRERKLRDVARRMRVDIVTLKSWLNGEFSGGSYIEWSYTQMVLNWINERNALASLLSNNAATSR